MDPSCHDIMHNFRDICTKSNVYTLTRRTLAILLCMYGMHTQLAIHLNVIQTHTLRRYLETPDAEDKNVIDHCIDGGHVGCFRVLTRYLPVKELDADICLLRAARKGHDQILRAMHDNGMRPSNQCLLEILLRCIEFDCMDYVSAMMRDELIGTQKDTMRALAVYCVRLGKLFTLQIIFKLNDSVMADMTHLDDVWCEPLSRSVLCTAVMNRDLGMVRFLVEEVGCDVNRKGPAVLAALICAPEIVEYLLTRGASDTMTFVEHGGHSVRSLEAR